MNPFDAYTIKARIAPALLVLLPLAVTVYAWLAPLEQPWVATWLAPAGLAALMGMSWDTRRAGQRLEDVLFARWGGKPTTAILRHVDATLAIEQKARYHRAIPLLLPDLTLPTEAEERAAPITADAVYDRAVAWLRAQTMDKNRFPLVADENATYGFHRNLLALRGLGFTASTVGVLGCGLLLMLPTTVRPAIAPAVFGLFVSLMCALVIARAATESRVKAAAFGYAIVLLRSLDGLPRPSKGSRNGA